MKRNKKHWRLSVVLLVVTGLLIWIVTMPDYGIHNKVKNAILKVMLSDNIPKISIADAVKKQEESVFLDSRSRKEYNVSHIPNATWVGYDEFDLSRVRKIAKQREIIVYCSIGKRSDAVTKKLMDAGFTNVQNLYGGIFEWFNQGNQIVDNANRKTNSIHAYSKLIGWWLERGEKVY